MRRKSGSLLRCQQNGCFVWLDIQACSPVTPRLRRALARVEKARTTCSSSLHCGNNKRAAAETPTASASSTGTSSSTSNNSPHNHQLHESKAKAAAQAWGMGGRSSSSLQEHVLTKEQTLDWFTVVTAHEEEEEEDADDEDTATEVSDSEAEAEGDGAEPMAAAASFVAPAAGGGGTGGQLPSLGCLSLAGSDSNTACTTSSSACSSEQLSGNPAAWTEEEQQRQQQEEAAMVREYSFREIFEYLSAGTKTGGSALAQSNSFCRPGSRTSSALSLCLSTPVSPATTMRTAHAPPPPRDSRPFSERMAAKCRNAPEECYGHSYGRPSTSASSWLLQNKYKVTGYVGKAAATLGLGTVVSSTASSTTAPPLSAPPMLEESGWDWYVDV